MESLSIETPADTARTRTPQPLWAIGSVAAAVVLYLVANLSMLLTRPDWSWSAFRDFGSGDQLSYLAYVVNVANGHSGGTEPFTETGSTAYPRAYYLALGSISRILHVRPEVMWSVGGVVVQVLLVISIGIACIAFTRRAWTGVLAALPFLLGVMSVATGHDWYQQMDSHAVLWGPFAVLFPLNGEALGLCVGAFCLMLMLFAALKVQSQRARLTIALLASVTIGSLANVQTYSFLSVVYIAAYVTATYGLITYRQRWPIILSVALVPVLFLVGPVFPFRGSQLVTLMLGLLPAIPGLITLVRRSRWLIVICLGVAGVAASPSVLSVLLGIYRHDPFLIYRVASSNDLGVYWWAGLLGSLVLSVPMALLFIAGLRRRRPIWVAYSVGSLVAWLLLSSNDFWGADQEPYRLWIDTFMLIAVSILPLVLSAIGEQLAGAGSAPAAPAPLIASSRAWNKPAPIGPRERKLSIAAVMVICALALVSMLDWADFYVSQHDHALIQLHGTRATAIAAASKPAGNGLILPDTCIDPLTLKAITGQRIAFMNVGMAWPAKYPELIDVNVLRGQGKLDLNKAKSAGVGWLLTESECSVDWAKTYRDHLEKASMAEYGSASIILWRLTY